MLSTVDFRVGCAQRSWKLQEFPKPFLDRGHRFARNESVIVSECRAIGDLDNAMDLHECPAQRIARTQSHRELVRMRDIAGNDQRPDRKLLDPVVLIVADDQYAVLTAAA